ncbi:MAG: hypothetical protein E6X17_06525 [Sporomusaceae bacterium]|nr:hypothetical protein [Sporomusaceae bacterium]
MTEKFKMTFHHIGKPVPLARIKDNKDTKYSPLFDMYSLDMKNDLSIPIELHAFGANSCLDYRIQQETHIAFKVNNIAVALEEQQIIMPLYQPFADYRCAMVIINEQLVELIETALSESEIWGTGIFKDSILYPK